MAGIASQGPAVEGGTMKTINCPKGHGPMAFKTIKKEMTFKGIEILVDADVYVCPECGLEAGTPQSAGALQVTVADAYRAEKGLLTSREIKKLRKSRNLTQCQLAEMMNVGIASIKRWETGAVQSASMDKSLRNQFYGGDFADNYSGNRDISLPRIKLVTRQFEALLGKRLLKKGDKFLYLAKYLWYADFTCFRQFGQSITGASYAALPHGPQLNNYKELIDPIKASDENKAETLSDDELDILKKIARKFPEEQMVYKAAHREKVWKDTKIGALISYSCAYELVGLK